MSPDLAAINASRFVPGRAAGFYESHFVRANHPSRALAFWIRFTVFSPRGRPQDAVGQLWALVFDGDAGAITAIKESHPLAACRFSTRALDIRIGDARLDGQVLKGSVARPGHRLAWDLRYRGDQASAFLLPLALYDGGFPKAKVLTGMPLAVFDGALELDGRHIDVAGWVGSQNHNWGERHTDRYAWGQVAGFDDDVGAFLECSTARLRIGPFWSPWFTSLVLRVGGREFSLNTLSQALRNRGRYRCFEWDIEARRGPLSIAVTMRAPRDRFVALGYDDPPGGARTCLNTKLGSCTVELREASRPPVRLHTASRAAFEILTVDETHGLAISA